MRRTWSVAVARHDPSESAWRRVGEVMAGWSREATITPVGEVMWLADTDSAAVADRIAAAVAELGAQPLRSSRTVYDPEDYAAADVVGVTGVDLSLDPPFVQNAETAYLTNPPCPDCGHQDPFDVTEAESPRIDEAMLDAPDPAGARPGPGGWEVVNLPGGGLLLSTRLVAALEDAEVRGLRTEPVLDARGNTSARMVQLRAPVAVLTPCPRHGHGGDFCPTCGTAHGEPDGYFWMPRRVVADSEIVSRHPRRAGRLYVSARVYRLLRDVPGVRRGDPARVCEH